MLLVGPRRSSQREWRESHGGVQKCAKAAEVKFATWKPCDDERRQKPAAFVFSTDARGHEHGDAKDSAA